MEASPASPRTLLPRHSQKPSRRSLVQNSHVLGSHNCSHPSFRGSSPECVQTFPIPCSTRPGSDLAGSLLTSRLGPIQLPALLVFLVFVCRGNLDRSACGRDYSPRLLGTVSSLERQTQYNAFFSSIWSKALGTSLGLGQVQRAQGSGVNNLSGGQAPLSLGADLGPQVLGGCTLQSGEWPGLSVDRQL